MTKLRRSASIDLRSATMASVLDMAKALCIACKQKTDYRRNRKRSLSLFTVKSCPNETGEFHKRDTAYFRMDPGIDPGGTHSRSASGTSAASLLGSGGAAATSRSVSMNSVSSEGSAENHVVEQEDIIVLTHDVKSFKEALGKLRRIFHPERDKNEAMRVAAHERLGEVLRILRSILEKYPPIQSTELLMTAGTLIQQVKGYNYEDEKSDPSDFFDAIDQLALAFSSRVSEYLMGDLDSSSQPVPKTRSCDNLLSADGESDSVIREKRFATSILTPQEIDARLAKLPDGVDLALRRAKVWSKYAKDVMSYIEKRSSLEAEHARNLVKLAQTMRPILKEENFLPFQSIYYMALDQDFENAQTNLTTCSLLQGHKFIEPLTARRNEHEKYRKQIKDTWHREVKRMQEAIANMRKAKTLYLQRQQEYEKAKESALRAENNESAEASKVDKKRRVEDDALQKAMEAETTYKSCVVEANERQLTLEKVKCEVLQQVRELVYQCDQTMKAVTVGYFQLQHTISAPAPVQFQTLCESSRLYEPGTQYMEFVKRLPQPPDSGSNGTVPFSFEPYFSDGRLERTRKSNGSTESSEDILSHSFAETKLSSDFKEKLRMQPSTKSWRSDIQATVASDSDSMSSCPSNKSQDTSPTASPHIHSRKVITVSSGDELETEHDGMETFSQGRRTCMSKAAETHTFRKLKTPSRCRECDSYVYFHGFECFECGLASHKKCLESLAIQCGRKRLPRKMNTFGVDLTAHAHESGENVPYIVNKCIAEIEDKGFCLKGIYRVSGVKSKVEKLCQSFENGAELVDLEGVHPNVIANVLKLYLRQLPEPLLTYRLYPEFIKIAKDYPAQKDENSHTPDGVISELQKLASRLPAVHFATLACLMHHLHRVSQHSVHNNMPPSNLGIVFGPTLLRTSEGSASLSSLVDTVHQTRVIELLITYAYEIFGPPPYLMSSQKDNEYLLKSQIKSARYQSVEKQILSRTVSGASQTSDFDELLPPDVGNDATLDPDDYPLPGFIITDKNQEVETSRHGSDVTHSSEDLLYSTILSDDDFPEILLSEDSVFRKSSAAKQNQNELLERKQSIDNCKSGQNLMKIQDARASLSSSPAVSEASHSSSLLRSTDDDSVSGGDYCWKENLLPVPPPRRNAPSNLQFNHGSFLTSNDQKAGTASVSESSGVSSAASTSPTGISDTSQSDSGNVYTSTAVVTLAGQKILTSPISSRTLSSVTAELRRQFFETPPCGSDVLLVKNIAASQADTFKNPVRHSSEECAPSISSFAQTHQRSTSLNSEKDVYYPSVDVSSKTSVDHKSSDDSISQSQHTHFATTSSSSDGKSSQSVRYVSPLGPLSYRSRGSSLSFASSSPQETEDRHRCESDHSNYSKFDSSIKRGDASQADVQAQKHSASIGTPAAMTKCSSNEKLVRYHPITVLSSESTEQTDSEIHASHKACSSKSSHSGIKDVSCVPTSLSSTSVSETSEQFGFSGSKQHSEVFSSPSESQQSEAKINEKLSPNREPRFV